MTMTCPKCGHQHPAQDETGALIPQCPACGIYYIKYFNQKSGLTKPIKKQEIKQKPAHSDPAPKEIRPEPTETEKLLAYQELSTHKTNHLLHFFITLFTVGFWLLPWFIMSASNTGERNKIRKHYNLPIESDTAGNLIKIALILFVIVIFVRGCVIH